MSSSRAETLEQLARLCRTGRDTSALPATESSGWSQLDAVLPGNGWQVGTLVELMPVTMGIGELRFVLPTLAKLSQGEHHIAFVSPPYIPFAPALVRHSLRLERLLVIDARSSEDTLWAFEQTLRCKSFGAVVAWCANAKDREIRRLQLAAESGRSIGFLFLPPSAALAPSPAAVRLRMQANENGLAIDVLKCRGTRSGMSVVVNEKDPAAEKMRTSPTHEHARAAVKTKGEEIPSADLPLSSSL